MALPPPTQRAHLVGVFVAATALLAGSCAEAFPPAGDRLAIGTWGGDNAGVIVTDSAFHVHVGCTFGDVTGTVPLDAEGRFTVDGSYVLRAYPILVGPSLPAQFSGRVVGRTLTFAVAVNDTVEKKVVALGPATVVFGRTPSMGPCPICRVPRRRVTAGAASMAARSVRGMD
jgi:hypothetical protein